MNKVATLPPREPARVFAGDGINSGWKVTLADHLAAVERARDEERLGIIAWLDRWSEGRSFAEQAVASLILEDLLKGD